MAERIVDVPEQCQCVERSPVGKDVGVAAGDDGDVAVEQRRFVGSTLRIERNSTAMRSGGGSRVEPFAHALGDERGFGAYATARDTEQ